MQSWLVYTLAALSVTLLGFSTYAVIAENKTALEAIPSNKPTFFGYRSCLNGCKKICDGPDSACRATSTVFQSCYAQNADCQTWNTKQSQLQSTDPMPDEFYNCYDKCAPSKVASSGYWTIYTCNVNCANENVQTTLLEASANKNVTFFDYEYCTTTKCRAQCAATDAGCLAASQAYQTCYNSDKTCQSWDQIQAQLQSDSPMPDVFFGCDKDCRPSQTQSSTYYSQYMCKANCGGIAQLSAAPTVTVFDYEQCQLKCNKQCAATDSACLGAAYKYSTCYQSDKTCQSWDALQAQLQSDSPMPAEYFGCDKDCRPAAGNAYYDNYMCKAKCAGAQ